MQTNPHSCVCYMCYIYALQSQESWTRHLHGAGLGILSWCGDDGARKQTHCSSVRHCRLCKGKPLTHTHTHTHTYQPREREDSCYGDRGDHPTHTTLFFQLFDFFPHRNSFGSRIQTAFLSEILLDGQVLILGKA